MTVYVSPAVYGVPVVTVVYAATLVVADDVADVVALVVANVSYEPRGARVAAPAWKSVCGTAPPCLATCQGYPCD